MSVLNCPSLPTIFMGVAVATILLAGNSQARDLCSKADYPRICRAVVRGQPDPFIATGFAINRLIVKSKRAKVLASRFGKDQKVQVCVEQFDDAVDNLRSAKKYLLSRNKASLNVGLSAALTDYVTCDDAFEEAGKPSPFLRTSKLLRRMASNCLYLTSLMP